MQSKGDKWRELRAIKSVCVIGAGVMGQAIASHMVNAGLDCMLIDMPKEGDRNQIALSAIKKIQTSKPSLVFTKGSASRIKTGNIEDDLVLVKNCDLVIEAVFEKIDIKQNLFKQLSNYIGEHTIIASNTSGLSIENMLEGLPPDFCQRFLVMHFFNPVRYLHLLEIVPAKKTKQIYLDAIIKFAEERLGKGVIIGKDTPNFVANRIGVYGMMETIKHVASGEYSIEEVDAIFGPALGRPKSAIFRTADVVGLDTFIHVAQNCFDNLPHDECHEVFAIPDFLQAMVRKGWLGQKSGQGFYKKEGDKILGIDPKTLTYQDRGKIRFESIGNVRHLNNLKEKIATVAYADDRAGKLFFTLAAKISIYAANRLTEIADNIVDIDNALKWGFGWELGPFETWDAMGVRKSVLLMEQRGLKVPAWVKQMLASGRESFYSEGPEHKTYVFDPHNRDQFLVKHSPREWKLEVIKREATRVVVDKDAYSLIDAQNGALIVEFHTKMNAIDNDILHGINEGLDRCESGQFEALVLANDGANFSVGANLLLLYMAASQNMWQEIDQIIRLFQSTGQRLRYSPVPTVAAPFSLTLGGGCELSMWCDRIHASAETYIGLVEAGVGLIPGGGGTVLMVARTLMNSINAPTAVIEPLLMRALETVATAKVATSALEAKEMTYLKEGDSFSMNRRFLIHDAACLAVAMARAGYIPEAPRSFRLPGKNAYATFDMGLRSFLGGKFISDYDFKVAMKVAHVMTGGNTHSYQEISENAMLDLEREAFLSLCGEQKTMERIAYMLENNKPLRN